MIKPEDMQSLQAGHRARLRKKFLDGQLAEYEILELLLTYAIPRRDVRAMSRQLFKKYGSISALLETPYDQLMENEGVRENTSTFFKVLHKLMQLEYKTCLDAAPIFHNYDKLENYCKLIVGGKKIEEFHVFYLDASYKLLEDQLHSSGTVNWAAVYIREIAKRALDLNARFVVLLHNHPTPYTSFSEQDIKITQELAETLYKLGIGLYDHLLVSADVVYSARNMHLIKD